MIFFRQSLGNKITERRDIERETNIPILGEVSYEDLGRDVIVVNQKNNLVGEQFRALRTNLHYFHNAEKERANLHLDLHKGVVMPSPMNEHSEDRGRVTLLTSSVSGEGKSWVSTNLAASIALSGRRTIVLEMDLRKPKLTGIFDLSKDHPGINEYLSYNTPIDNIIQPSGKVKNLDIIGSGQIPDEPSEILEKERLTDLINELRDRYDDIVIDTPPLHLVTDAMIIARHTDVSLYIIRQGYTGKDELEFVKEVADTKKLPHINIVFNGIKRGKYGYGYNYDNSYYSKSSSKTAKGSFKKFLSRF
jgi:capsular exopolysaccharide synthesis family protein